MRPLPGASKNAAIATASSTKTTSPIDELRILTECGFSHEVAAATRRTGKSLSPAMVGTDANDYHLSDGLPALQRLMLDLMRYRDGRTAA